MNVLDQIFATNPALLETPEVKALADYAKEQHQISIKINQSLHHFHAQVSHLVMNSAVVVIGGTPPSQVVKEIITLYGKEL